MTTQSTSSLLDGLKSRTWTTPRLLGVAAPLVICAVLMAFGSRYQILLAMSVMNTLLLALSLNIVVGNLGLFSLAHSAFFAAGAYISAILTVDYSFNAWLTLPFSLFGAGFMSMILGLPVARLRGIFLAVATLAFASFFEVFVSHATHITRGAYGIAGIQPLVFFGIPLRGPQMLLLVTIALVVVLVLLINLSNSALGRSFIAVRDNEAAAAASGIPIDRTRLTGFMLSATIAGGAGWLYTFSHLVVTPHIVSLEQTFVWFFMVLIGGAGSIAGVVLGALLLTLGPELLGLNSSQQVLISGGLMLAAVMFAPRGLVGLLNFKFLGRQDR